MIHATTRFGIVRLMSWRRAEAGLGTQRKEADKLQSEVGVRRTKKSNHRVRTRIGKTGGKTQGGKEGCVDG